MSKEELKQEINLVLDQLSERSLEELLNTLRKNTPKGSPSIFDPEQIQRILSEDAVLLQKLAQ